MTINLEMLFSEENNRKRAKAELYRVCNQLLNNYTFEDIEGMFEEVMVALEMYEEGENNA